MEFFRAHARVIWLGHHQDDIAETMLMRLARGSGTAGLAAPRPVQRFAGGHVHVRPLLALKKAEVLSALRACGLAWREDSTNPNTAHFRNRVRSQVVPIWTEAAQRDAVAGAARSRSLLEEDDMALEAWVATLGCLDAQRGLVLERIAGRPRAVVRRALHHWMAAQRRPIDVSRHAFDALLTAIEAGRAVQHSLGHEYFGVVRAGVLRLVFRRALARKIERRIN